MLSREDLSAQLQSLDEQRQVTTNNLHRIAGAEAVVQGLLAKLDRREAEALEMAKALGGAAEAALAERNGVADGIPVKD